MGRYYEYLDEHEIDFNTMGVDDLRRHALLLTDEDGSIRDRYTLYKSLVFDTALQDAQGETFHLCEGNWYRIDDAYIARLSTYLDPLCFDSDLPAYDHPSEGEYNAAVAAGDAAIACLDKRDISPDGQTAVEPCDLWLLVTVSRHSLSTLSAQLSHFFDQGVNAIELMRLEPRAVENLEALIHEVMNGGDPDALVALVQDRKYRIVFGIVTRKEPCRSIPEPTFVFVHQLDAQHEGTTAYGRLRERHVHCGSDRGSGRPQEEAEEERHARRGRRIVWARRR
ncbi:TIGR04141 family sporadically distributed protein [Mesorhizobium sp. M0296]|uniref:TIGR04141 family sporadically distributed protein n=1 Tax=Mesorhizobium sp. M0296 TaxID=2956931 RepID=UPI0033383B7D